MSYRRKPRTSKKLKISAIVIVSIIAIAAFIFYNSGEDNPVAIITGLSTVGYNEMLVDAAAVNGYGIVGLESGCYRILATVEGYQAESIRMGVEGEVGDRPNSHDIVVDAFENLGVHVLMVKITEARNDTFYGKIILRNGNMVADLDARPSDATAIAVRMDVPVYMKTELLEKYGEYIC